MKFDRLRRFLEEFKEENHCSIIHNYNWNLDQLHELMKRNQRWEADDHQHRRMKNQHSLVRKVKKILNCSAQKLRVTILVGRAIKEFESRRARRSNIKEFSLRFHQLIIFHTHSFKSKLKNPRSKIPKRGRFIRNHWVKTCLIRSRSNTLRS